MNNNKNNQAKFNFTGKKNKWRLCDDKDEMANHISECSKLEKQEFKTLYDWVGKVIQWELCKELKFRHAEKWTNQNLS